MNYLLLNSGTPESKALAVFLSRAVSKDDEIHSLFLDFGLPNRAKALESAQKIAEKYCTTHGVMNCQMQVEGINITPLYFDKFTAEYIPHALTTTEQRAGDTLSRLIHYPYYIHKTVTEAFAYARTVAKATKIYMVHNRNGEEWFKQFAEMFNNPPPPNRPYEPIELVLPFYGLDLAETLEAVGLTAADITDTVFCLEETPCGKCSRCLKVATLNDDGDDTRAAEDVRPYNEPVGRDVPGTPLPDTNGGKENENNS